MQFTSRCTIAWDGNQLRTEAGSSIDTGGLTADDTLMTDQGVFGYKEKYMPCIIKGNVCHAADTDMLALRAARDVTVTFSTDTGKTYTTVGVCAVVGEMSNGRFPIEFRGSPAKES